MDRKHIITLLRAIPNLGRRGPWGIRRNMGIELSGIGGGGRVRDFRGNMGMMLSGIGGWGEEEEEEEGGGGDGTLEGTWGLGCRV